MFADPRLVTTGLAVLVPLAVVVTIIATAPNARAVTLLWPLVAMTVLAMIVAILSSLVLGQPHQRSIVHLRRLARRALMGDIVGSVLPSTTYDLKPIAQDLVELAHEIERTRASLDRVTRDLRLTHDGNESLVSTLAIANTRLRAEATLVHDFVDSANRPLDREQMCLQLLHALDNEVPYQEALVYLVEPDTSQLRLAAACDRERNYRRAGRYLRELPNFTVELGHARNLPNVVCQAGKSIRVADSLVDQRFTGLSDRMRSYLAVPLEVNDRVIGAMQIGDLDPDRYDDHDERQVATLAHFAALWIENIHLFEEAAKVEAFKRVDQLKSELLSTVSHELRTPLSSIKGYASSLLREDIKWEDETRREFLMVIDEESDRLTALIEDLLQMSEIEAGVLRVDRQPVKISRLAQKIVKKLRTQTRDHQVSVNVVADVPETLADPRRIEQVLHNLIGNALKYSQDGSPVQVRVERRGADVLVSVRDQGIGIPLEHLDHVFDRFYRVDGTLARQTGGSGLGLAICRGLVEAHGGKIWVESQLTKGSTFFFTIPLTPPEVIAKLSSDVGSPAGDSSEE
ncbi:MAG TPA: ATP-binding protein [Chloroflexota bacterium]|nr:ATP-binding protein [Chloroflexota bacterium]